MFRPRESEENAELSSLPSSILPDTDVDRERTLAGRSALGVFVLVFVFVLLAFTTANWIEGDPRIYGTKTDHVGLWVHCFRSLPDYTDLDHTRYFAGCRWIFDPFTKGYANIRGFLAPPFFVATQFFFTLSFLGTLVSLVLIVAYALFVTEQRRVATLRWTAVALLASGVLGSLALIIFGIYGHGPSFMPDWEHNYLSWSYALAFVGVLGQFVDGVLFLTEARIQRRKEMVREQKFPMERRV